MSLEEKLKDFLEKGKDWERIRTTINGIFILKINIPVIIIPILSQFFPFFKKIS